MGGRVSTVSTQVPRAAAGETPRIAAAVTGGARPAALDAMAPQRILGTVHIEQ